MTETEDYDKSAAAAAHKTSHQDGGTDEISVLGLSGLLADDQTPLAHKTSHQLLGADALSVAGLSGLLADDQHVLDSEAISAMGAKANSNPLNHDRYADSETLAAAVQSGAITDGVTKAPTHDAVYDVKVMTEAHKARHENEGLDEISVAGLSGLLADDQHVLDSEALAVVEQYLPWMICIDVFMPPKANTNWTTVTLAAVLVHNARKDSSGTQNDEISWDIVLGAGTWKFYLMSSAGENVGIYSIQFDSVEKGTIDGYDPVWQHSSISSPISINVPTTKKIELKLKMATKNSSSGGYRGLINGIQLIRAA